MSDLNGSREGGAYLLGLSRLSEDESEQAEADLLMLGRSFAHLGGERGEEVAVTHMEETQAQLSPRCLRTLGLTSNGETNW